MKKNFTAMPSMKASKPTLNMSLGNSGWKGESARHRNAKVIGSAGSVYADEKRKMEEQVFNYQQKKGILDKIKGAVPSKKQIAKAVVSFPSVAYTEIRLRDENYAQSKLNQNSDKIRKIESEMEVARYAKDRAVEESDRIDAQNRLDQLYEERKKVDEERKHIQDAIEKDKERAKQEAERKAEEDKQKLERQEEREYEEPQQEEKKESIFSGFKKEAGEEIEKEKEEAREFVREEQEELTDIFEPEDSEVFDVVDEVLAQNDKPIFSSEEENEPQKDFYTELFNGIDLNEGNSKKSSEKDIVDEILSESKGKDVFHLFNEPKKRKHKELEV